MRARHHNISRKQYDLMLAGSKRSLKLVGTAFLMGGAIILLLGVSLVQNDPFSAIGYWHMEDLILALSISIIGSGLLLLGLFFLALSIMKSQ